MGFIRLLCTFGVATLTLAAPTIDTAAYSSSSIIHRDVCIIGGGSTGTYSAVRLHDSGKSVAVVEAKGRLGGHTNTYVDPATKGTVDIGVIVFHNLTIVKDYFARFNIPLTAASFADGKTSYVDYRTGKLVAYTPKDPFPGLATYGAQLAKYPYVETGFNLPDPIPADLLLPFGDFIKIYAIQDSVQFIFTFAQGLGDLLSQPTLYVFKNFGLGILQDLRTGFLTTAHHDNSELYRSATTLLGPSVFLNSHVLATDRSGRKSVKILIQTPHGKKLIIAKKLLVTIPPKIDNLVGFDLSHKERGLFKQFRNSAYYTGVLRNTGIPANTSIVNIGADTPYNIPALPGIYSINPTGIPGLQNVKFGSATALSDTSVKSEILASVARLGAAGTFNVSEKAELATYASHTPFELTVPAEAIRGGFYGRLYALQGRRRTWWTGAAWHTHDSSLLWEFSEGVVGRVLEGL